jgi:ferredoxin-like protein FixX
MAIFIELVVDPALASDPALAGQLASVCPVDIFAQTDGGALEIIDANLDECTLCELCLQVGKPGQVKVMKLYDGSAILERS